MPKRKQRKRKQRMAAIEQTAVKAIEQIGSIPSIVIHTGFFLLFFFLGVIGFDWNALLLILTTIVSLEAIYLAIFIQMTVNRNTASLAEVEEDLDEIQEDIDEIAEDVDELAEEIDEIAEDEREAETHEQQQDLTLKQIQSELRQLTRTIEKLAGTKRK